MALWDKFFGSRDKAPAVRGAPAQVRSPTPVNPAPAGPASIAQIMLEAKRGRYAHLAKHHELAGEWSEADANYAALADAQQRTRGEADPDLASVAFEIAHLNHRQEFERNIAPERPDGSGRAREDGRNELGHRLGRERKAARE